jgi:membrane protein DedA with SNARE-associated domain
MSSFVALLLSFLLLYKYWALFAVMFVAAVILPIPTNSVLLATGAFASQGYFSFSLSLVVAVGANILGDCFDYFLARRYGRRVIHMLHIRIPSYIERLEEYVKRHPGPTIFLTRFVGTADPLANVLSGFVGISFGTFLLYDFLGNVVSIGGVLYAGYFLGIHWQDFSTFFSIAGWILLGFIVIAALAVALWYRNRVYR